MDRHIKVAVRIRPPSERELSQQNSATSAIAACGNAIIVQTSPPRKFDFDASYASHDVNLPEFASQERVYEDIGRPVFADTLNGTSSAVLSYGQTGSGKSHSILGFVEARGIIPRMIDDIFAKKKQSKAAGNELRVWLSYFELRSEHIHDLLQVGRRTTELKPVDHPKLGVILPGITEVPCETPFDVQKLMHYGTRVRASSATQLFGSSSRSHTFLCIRLHVLEGLPSGGAEREAQRAIRARVTFADFGGSERQAFFRDRTSMIKSGFRGECNLSLLGLLVRELAQKRGSAEGRRVPFTASKLTMLLKEPLDGTCRTTLLATVSPARTDLDETIATLQFASAARGICTVAARKCCARQQHVDSLENKLMTMRRLTAEQARSHIGVQPCLEEQATALEQKIASFGRDYHQELEQAQRQDKLRARVFQEMSRPNSIKNLTPYLLNASDDPSLAGCLLYYLHSAMLTTIGTASDCTIQLAGIGIVRHLCAIDNRDNKALTVWKCDAEGHLVVGSTRLVEGRRHQLQHGQRIFVGRAYALRVAIPSLMPQENSEHEQDADLFLDGQDDSWAAVGDSETWKSLQEYLSQMVHHMRADQIATLTEEVRAAVKVCDEMSEITRELRPTEALNFEVDLTSAVPATVVVRVLRSCGSTPDGVESFEPLYAWSLHEVQERLERMRDCYHTFVCTGQAEIDPFFDPWHEVQGSEMTRRIQCIYAQWAEADAHTTRLANARRRIVDATMRSWLDQREAELLNLVLQSWRRRTHQWTAAPRRRTGDVRDSQGGRQQQPVLTGPPKTRSASPLGRAAAARALAVKGQS